MGRATPLPPELRRQAIIEAAGPLLVSTAGQFTTKQVAEAAQIAEGTIFRVFDSKQDLLHAVIEDALDPSELCAQIRLLTDQESLDDHITALVRLLRAKHETISALTAALHAAPAGPAGKQHHGHDMSVFRERLITTNQAIAQSLAPWADRLSVPTTTAASLIDTLARAAAQPFLCDTGLPDAATLARVIVHGIVKD